MSSTSITNLTNEIVIAKNAAASATNKITNLLNEVYSLKTKNIDISDKVEDLINQVININHVLNNESFHDTIDASFQEIISVFQNFDLCYNNLVSDSCFNDLKEYFQTKVLQVLDDATFNNVDISGTLTINNKSVIDVSSIQDYNYVQLSTLTYILNDYQLLSNNNSLVINDAGQTYFQIMTQQPRNFTMNGSFSTTSQIDISWNYDFIRVFDNCNNFLKSSLQLNNKASELLPNIYTITIELSNNNVSTGWVNYDIINITPDKTYLDYTSIRFEKYIDILNNSNYNSDYSKNLILSYNENFDVRIYGTNNASNKPNINDRSLIFYNLSFLPAGSPSKPEFIDSISNNNDNTITFDYNVLKTINDSSDTTNLIQYELSMIGYETLASSTINYTYNNLNQVYNFNDQDGQFTLTKTGLRYGTRYYNQVRVKNDLNDNYSEYSDPSLSVYTNLPNSNGISSNIIINNNNFSNQILSLYTHEGNVDRYYLNKHNNQYFNINTNITFEITNPNTNINHVAGFGKFIDNSENLVTITALVNDVSKQQIVFGGFNVDVSSHLSSTDFFNTTQLQQYDIYTDISKQGFRLKGIFELQNLHWQTIANDSSLSNYKLTYKYSRHPDVGGNLQDISYLIYIDDFSGNPGITVKSQNITVTSVKYNMGIPTVKDFSLAIEIEYSNINSQSGILKSNQIGSVTLDNSVNTVSSDFSLLSSNDICGQGIYNHTHIINGIEYSITQSTIINQLKYYINTSNLYNPKVLLTNINTNHYYDSNSFNGNDNILDLSNVLIYEIADISNGFTNLNNLQFDHYDNHMKQINPWTLMYVSGKFQTNTQFAYPNINTLSYQNFNLDNSYNSGSIAYNLSGDEDISGYKWVAFKIDVNTSKNQYNGLQYIPLNYIFTNYFGYNNQSEIDDVFNYATTDRLIFSYANFNHSFIIGNIMLDADVQAGRWTQNGQITNSLSLETVYQETGYTYAARVKNGTEYGVEYRNYQDLIVLVGIKNSVN